MVSQVGWIKFDGDEHHGFVYWTHEDRKRLDYITAQGFLPVYAPDTLDEDLAILRLNDGFGCGSAEVSRDSTGSHPETTGK